VIFIILCLPLLPLIEIKHHHDDSAVGVRSYFTDYQIKEGHVKTAVSFMKELYPLANNLKVKFIKPSELLSGSDIVSTFDYKDRIYTVKLKCNSTICLVMGNTIE
jgi:hypothetical protein